jgi:hypothetical protein
VQHGVKKQMTRALRPDRDCDADNLPGVLADRLIAVNRPRVISRDLTGVTRIFLDVYDHVSHLQMVNVNIQNSRTRMRFSPQPSIP